MHNTEYVTYDEKVDKRKVEAAINESVSYETRYEGSGGLVNSIRWLENCGVANDYDEAKALIESKDRGWYDCLAVRYKSMPRNVSSKALEDVKSKVTDAYKKYIAADNYLYFKDIKSDYIGCKSCGSKLARNHLRTNFCPLCRNDLRSETLRTRILSMKSTYEKWITKQKELEASITKKSGEVKWLVKYEYHT